MDLLKKAFTTPAKQTAREVRPVSTDTAATAPPGQPAERLASDIPAIDAAINDIANFEFNPGSVGSTATPLASAPPLMANNHQYVMFSPPPPPRTLEPLETETWPFPKNTSPNPISINRAREILAAAYAEIDCELPGADVHGHAWMVENKAEWNARSGTSDVSIPTRPALCTDYADGLAQATYHRKKDLHRVYMHMAQEGKKQLIAWFGKSMFVDLHVNKALPTYMTPRAMLEHLEGTYAKPRHYRQHMAIVQKEFEAAFNHKKPVENYFLQLQECQDDSRLLRRPFTDEQVMDKAMEQFVARYGNDARKAETRWNRAIDKGTYKEEWKDFKQFWKEEIHDFATISGAETHNATQIDELTARMETMSVHMAHMEAENRNYRNQSAEAHSAQQFRDALKADFIRREPRDDEMSALTGVISELSSRVDRLSHSTSTDQTTDTSGTNGASRRRELLANAKARAPDSYKIMNDGKGRQFKWYCFHCGCNCTHSTKGCYEMTDEDKAKYKHATVKNTLGGSTKFLDRYCKYQSEFGFDSL